MAWSIRCGGSRCGPARRRCGSMRRIRCVTRAIRAIHRSSTWSTPTRVPSDTLPTWSVEIPIKLGPLPVGVYTLNLDMANGGRPFSADGVPKGVAQFEVTTGSTPTIKGNFPPHGGYVDSLRPTLWVDYF